MKKLLSIIFLLTYNLQLTAYSSFADTVYTKDGKELKGIIVEDYKDRVVFSTADGQLTLMKSDVRELYFDTEEQNMIKLAEQSRDKGDYTKAFAYYDKAFKMNPGSKAARDGIVFLQGYLFKKDISHKEEVVRRHNDFEQKGQRPEIKSEEDEFNDDVRKLRSESGIALLTKDNITKIESSVPGSPAYEAGIRKGDMLVAIWGRLVGYMSLKEIVETLLEKNSLETKITLERNVDVPVDGNGSIGAALTMELEGLTVSGIEEYGGALKAGLKPGDLITKINGDSTLYMPLKNAIGTIKKSKNGEVNLNIRKEIIMWGERGA